MSLGVITVAMSGGGATPTVRRAIRPFAPSAPQWTVLCVTLLNLELIRASVSW